MRFVKSLRRVFQRVAAKPRHRLGSTSVPSSPGPAVSVVLGSYNRRLFLEAAIDSVRANCTGIRHEIIVVDGGSDDGSIEWLIAQRDVITIIQHNRGTFRGNPIERKSWGYFMNLGFKAAKADWILMISDDCLLLEGAIARSLETAQAAIARGAKLGGVAYFFRNWPADRKYYVQETTGRRLMVNHGLFARKALEAVGFANEDDYVFYKADGDLSLRIWEADYEIIPAPDSFVEHFFDEGELVRQSNNTVLNDDRAVYARQWGHLRGKPRSIEADMTDHSMTAQTVFGAIAADLPAGEIRDQDG